MPARQGIEWVWDLTERRRHQRVQRFSPPLRLHRAAVLIKVGSSVAEPAKALGPKTAFHPCSGAAVASRCATGSEMVEINMPFTALPGVTLGG